MLTAYDKARDVTAKRLYLETMEDVLKGMNKVILDGQPGGAGGSGVVPYLPLPGLDPKARPAPTAVGGAGQ